MCSAHRGFARIGPRFANRCAPRNDDWLVSRQYAHDPSRRTILSGRRPLGRSDRRAARCLTCCRRRRATTARGRRSNSATGRSAMPSWKRMVEVAASAFLRAGYGKNTFGRAVPRQHARSSRQFLRRAEGRRPHRASVAARRRDRAVAQALGFRRAGAGHHQPFGAAADRAEIPRSRPARPPDRLRGRSLGQGRHAADAAAR